MISKPEISVIMPAYNEAKRISRAIKSILSQTFTNFELIIINDCSKDDTQVVIDSFNDVRIVSLMNAENMGVMKSLNRGLEMAQGDYVARMDADDFSLPNRLEKQINYMSENPDVVLCATGAVTSYPDYQKIHKTFNDHSEIIRYSLKENPFVHSTVMFVKHIDSDIIRYTEKTLEDYDLWMRLIHRYKVGFINEILVMRYEEENLSKNTYSWAKNKKSGVYYAKYKIQRKYLSSSRFKFLSRYYLLQSFLKYRVSRLFEKA